MPARTASRSASGRARSAPPASSPASAMPQMTAIMDLAEEAQKSGTPVIADSGIKYSGDLPRRSRPAPIAPWSAHSWPEPTRRRARRSYQGRSYKAYRHRLGRRDGALGRPLLPAGHQDSLKLVPKASRGRWPTGAGRQRAASACRRPARRNGLCRRQGPRRPAPKAEFVRISSPACARATCTT